MRYNDYPYYTYHNDFDYGMRNRDIPFGNRYSLSNYNYRYFNY